MLRVDHAMIFPRGGFPILRYNITADELSEVCSGVAIKPTLHTLSEWRAPRQAYCTANRHDEVRLDVSAKRVWDNRKRILYIRVFTVTRRPLHNRLKYRNLELVLEKQRACLWGKSEKSKESALLPWYCHQRKEWGMKHLYKRMHGYSLISEKTRYLIWPNNDKDLLQTIICPATISTILWVRDTRSVLCSSLLVRIHVVVQQNFKSAWDALSYWPIANLIICQTNCINMSTSDSRLLTWVVALHCTSNEPTYAFLHLARKGTNTFWIRTYATDVP